MLNLYIVSKSTTDDLLNAVLQLLRQQQVVLKRQWGRRRLRSRSPLGPQHHELIGRDCACGARDAKVARGDETPGGAGGRWPRTTQYGTLPDVQ